MVKIEWSRTMLKAYIQAKDLMFRIKSNESGASLAEYALIIALVLVGVGVTLGLLTTAVNAALGAGTTELNTASGAGAGAP